MCSLIKNFVSLFLITLIAGCGGGGGASVQTLSGSNPSGGQAAVGVPMSNAAINIKSLIDSTSSNITADADGNFNIPANVTYPALVTATSLDFNYVNYGYISSNSQTSVAVNTLTTLILAIANNGDPSTISQPISSGALTSAQTSVSNLFSQILNLAGISLNTNYLTTTFSTNHAGLDLILDAITFDYSKDGVITITNKINLNKTSFSISGVNSVPSIDFSSTLFSQLQNVPLAACTSFLNSITSARESTESGLYDSNYLNNGLNAAQNMANIIGQAYYYTMPVFQRIDPNGNYVFRVIQVNASTNLYSNYMLATVKSTSGGGCALVGNQYPITIRINPNVMYIQKVDGNSQYVTTTPVFGHIIQIGAKTNVNTYNGTQITGASVEYCTNSSSCSEIATLTATMMGPWILNPTNSGYDPNLSPYNLVPSSVFSQQSSLQAPIRITFWDASSNPVGAKIYTSIGGVPFTSSEVAALTMPTITNPNILQQSSISPVANFNSGSTIIRDISISNLDNGVLNVADPIVLQAGSGTVGYAGFNLTSTASDRRLQINAFLPNRPGVSVTSKMIWNPNGPAAR